MCLLVVCYKALPDCPLLVFANRDERRSRASEPPRLHDAGKDQTAWLGGRDLEQGGTWIGLNQFGLVVAVTNRPKATVDLNVRSRGLLCRDLLRYESAESAAEEAQRQMAQFEFAGFNLLLLSAGQCTVIEAGDRKSTIRLTAGVHVIANRGLNDLDDPRVVRAKREIEQRQAAWTGWQVCFQSAAEICRLPAADALPGICLTGPDWGTVSSTIIALPDDVRDVRYHYASGPPCEMPYEDYSLDARRLLHEQATNVAPEGGIHRMHLRGPWEVEWVSNAESPPPQPSPAGGEGERQATDSGRVKLPADWQSLFGERRGTVRFTRRFGKPTNLEPHEKVFIAFDGIGGVARVSVNGSHVGIIENSTSTIRFDVTALLNPSNTLDVVLTYTETDDASSPGGLYAPVAIEVHR
ncbi:MAG: NRDE family protein [Planctomycetaceae bacterium]